MIEITYESNFEFGLDYLWSRAAGRARTLFQGANGDAEPRRPSSAPSSPGGFPFQGTSLLFGFLGKNAERFGLADVTLQAMEMEGKAEVLSKPSIICTQNVPAEVTTTEARQITIFDRGRPQQRSSTRARP